MAETQRATKHEQRSTREARGTWGHALVVLVMHVAIVRSRGLGGQCTLEADDRPSERGAAPGRTAHAPFGPYALVAA